MTALALGAVLVVVACSSDGDDTANEATSAITIPDAAGLGTLQRV